MSKAKKHDPADSANSDATLTAALTVPAIDDSDPTAFAASHGLSSLQ